MSPFRIPGIQWNLPFGVQASDSKICNTPQSFPSVPKALAHDPSPPSDSKTLKEGRLFFGGEKQVEGFSNMEKTWREIRDRISIYFTSHTVFVSECVLFTSHGVSVVFHRGQLGQTKKSGMPGNPVSESNLNGKMFGILKKHSQHPMTPRLQLEMIDLTQGREHWTCIGLHQTIVVGGIMREQLLDTWCFLVAVRHLKAWRCIHGVVCSKEIFP